MSAPTGAAPECCIPGASGGAAATGASELSGVSSSETVIGGVPCFRASLSGSGGGGGRRAIIIVTDIFGYEAEAARLNAVRAAARGAGALDVFIPKLCTPVRADFQMSELPAWFAAHPDEGVQAALAAVSAALRADGYGKMLAIGYCWGARGAQQATSGAAPLFDALAVAHPTRTGGAAEYLAARVPTLLLLAETDVAFPPETAAAVAEALRARAAAEPALKFAQLGPFAGTVHGFAARGDEADVVVGAARRAANDGAVDFLLAL